MTSLFRAIYFCAYDSAKRFFNNVFVPETPGVHICSAAFAGKLDEKIFQKRDFEINCDFLVDEKWFYLPFIIL